MNNIRIYRSASQPKILNLYKEAFKNTLLIEIFIFMNK